jgi:hypothetical protein
MTAMTPEIHNKSKSAHRKGPALSCCGRDGRSPRGDTEGGGPDGDLSRASPLEDMAPTGLPQQRTAQIPL